MPQFHGNLLNWWTFQDIFVSLTQSNTKLSNINRFNNLIVSVLSTASIIVRFVLMVDTNYAVAWKSLHGCFDDFCIIIHVYLNKLFDLLHFLKILITLSQISKNTIYCYILTLEANKDFLWWIIQKLTRFANR